jgi:hypothetical protein
MFPSTRPVEPSFEHLSGNLSVLRGGNSTFDRAGFANDQIAYGHIAFQCTADHQGIEYRNLTLDGDSFADIEPVRVGHSVFGRSHLLPLFPQLSTSRLWNFYVTVSALSSAEAQELPAFHQRNQPRL